MLPGLFKSVGGCISDSPKLPRIRHGCGIEIEICATWDDPRLDYDISKQLSKKKNANGGNKATNKETGTTPSDEVS